MRPLTSANMLISYADNKSDRSVPMMCVKNIESNYTNYAATQHFQ
jgi:hypothetical protein